jgi:hypothetical protein
MKWARYYRSPSVNSNFILSTHVALRKIPWNKGKVVGQKALPKLNDIWAIRVDFRSAAARICHAYLTRKTMWSRVRH